MERTERFCKIEMLIRSRGCVSFADLMTELAVSRATLKRDLDHLRTRMDAAIVYDRDRNGYRFETVDRNGRRSFTAESPGVWFNEREIHALLTMHQLLDGLGVNGSMGRHLQPLLDKLTGMLGTSESEARELTRRVRVVAPVHRPVRGRHFERLASAVLERRRLRLTVEGEPGGCDRDRDRVVSPMRLVHEEGVWFLDSWDHDHEALCRIALPSVRSVQTLEARAKEVAMRVIEAELDTALQRA
ncbi:helix-turn-helix transcriptional regulator [Sphaerotilus sp.]|jgi:predicted DNA-binding transcriptional regulator YafY|uniref:helix-turn-helix transcriptional regulator n=1 Tax=Sphaerotilus sp. TaxID=2093942 RepID=UPI0025F4C54B|nr:WYL domain-containing protein [Sphaerotilus sp.]